MTSADPELVDAGFFKVVTGKAAACCVPDGSVDDTLGMRPGGSGVAVSGSTVCTNPSGFSGTTWASCRHVCGSAQVNGCIPSGGWDDTLSLTRCCGAAVPGRHLVPQPCRLWHHLEVLRSEVPVDPPRAGFSRGPAAPTSPKNVLPLRRKAGGGRDYSPSSSVFLETRAVNSIK